jgi:nucleotide-binding universal stress UspA family protein
MFKTIVVGTDGSGTAQAALQQAIALARQTDATLHVVSAYAPVVSSPMLAAAGELGAAAMQTRALEDERTATEARLAALQAELNSEGVKADIYPIAGNAAEAIVSVAETAGADLIIVGSRGMHRRVLGSVPNTVAHHAPCHVMIIKTT